MKWQCNQCLRKGGALLLAVLCTANADAMHIAEGFLPLGWSIAWGAVFLLAAWPGYRALKRLISDEPRKKMLLSVAIAFVFVLSSLKLPSIGGSSSHLTGVAFGALLLGAPIMSIAGAIVLLFQAVLLAHGGLTTLGANAVSMAVVGPWLALAVYAGCKTIQLPVKWAVFMAAFISTIGIYLTTALQLGLAFPQDGSRTDAFLKFATLLGTTQLPLAVLEALLTVGLIHLLQKQGVLTAQLTLKPLA